MSYNQSLIKDLRFDTIAKAKTRDARGKLAYIEEKDAMYFGVVVADGTTNNIADDDLYLATPTTDVFWKKQITGAGEALPASGDAAAPADGTPSSIAPTITFADVQGKTAGEAIMALHFPATVPTQTAPVLTRVAPTDLTIDKGQSLTSIQVLFTQNQGGAVNSNYSLTIASEAPIVQASDTFDVSASAACQSIVAATAFAASVGYDAGLVPDDSYGNPSPDDQIPAGTATLNFTVTPVVHTFHGLQLKGEDLTAKTSAELRTLADSLTQATGTLGTFANVTVPNTSDYYVLVPGTKSTVTTVSQGFTITGIGTIEGQVEIDDKFGTATSTYTIVKLAGQAAESVIDTVTIS